MKVYQKPKVKIIVVALHSMMAGSIGTINPEPVAPEEAESKGFDFFFEDEEDFNSEN